MTHRPKYNTNPDENHSIPRDYLHDRCGGFDTVKYGNTLAYTANYMGHPFLLVDTSKYGGIFPDYLLFCLDREEFRLLEVKTESAYKEKNHGATPGEYWMGVQFGDAFQFIVTEEDFQEVLEGMI